MNEHILDKVVQAYINSNLNADVNKIALSKSPFLVISASELANQIVAKKKAEKKLPTWYNTNNIYYPPALSIEQTSSETTAKYKLNLAIGESLIDLTGGFGVDTFFFSKKIKEITHCEISADLSQIAKYNAALLHQQNIIFKNVDGIDFISKTSSNFDTIYLDPARRAEKGKVFMLKDCTPDVISNLDLLLEKAKRIIIKTAPLLDLTAGLNELKNVSEIHIVSVKNECKELLWVLDKEFKGEVKIIAASLNAAQKEFSFLKPELNVDVDFVKNITINDFLYEPDAALLKSGAFNLIGNRYGLSKLHYQTQLYTANYINSDFPGRIFKIIDVFNTSDFKKQKSTVGNVIVRNYPAKAEDLEKKYKIKSDKNQFLIFSKITPDQNLVIKAEIIQHY
jgi:hypothetical protein